MKTTFELEGFEDLDHALTELPKATGRNVLIRTGKEALEPMAEDARQRAPDDAATSGEADLKSNIIVATRRRAGGRPEPKASAVEVFMGPTTAAYPKAIVQETGAGPHYVVKGSGRKRVRLGLEQTDHKMHPGHPPQPYMRPAWDHGADSLLERVKVALADQIERARARLARKAERQAAKSKRV